MCPAFFDWATGSPNIYNSGGLKPPAIIRYIFTEFLKQSDGIILVRMRAAVRPAGYDHHLLSSSDLAGDLFLP